MFDTMLFDLDGTLTDPYDGITKCVKHALTYYNIEENDEKLLRSFIGPPLARRFTEVYGFDERVANEAVDHFRERFTDIGIYENKLYDGIADALSKLKEQGVTLAVATSKPEPFACRVLDHFSLSKYFSVVSGSTFNGSHVEKNEVIASTLNRLGGSRNAIMVGDRSFDIIGAKANGLKSVGVSWGYAEPGELEKAGADFLIDFPSQLTELTNDNLCKMYEIKR